MAKFNPLDFPISFTQPLRLDGTSAWVDHIPFGMLLIDILRPKVLVELGTHTGVSYSAFCQAVQQLHLDTRCYAVDTWEGDVHSFYYGPEVLAEFRAYHDPLYGEFSRLIQSTFDEAGKYFTPGSIDLLHIDGLHTYEAVRHDFETWLPKLSGRAVVLFHDTNVRERDFGVWKFWAEVRQQYPHFEFVHGHGLGVLVIGSRPVPALAPFISASADQAKHLRGLFFALGARISAKTEQDRKVQEYVAWIAKRDQQIGLLTSQGVEKERAVQTLSAQLVEEEHATQSLSTQLAEKDHTVQSLSAQLIEKEQAYSRQVIEMDREAKASKTDREKTLQSVKWHQDRISILQAQLQELQSGLAHQMMDKYRRGVEKYVPAGTRKRHYYDLSIKGFRVLFLEGPVSLWRNLRHRKVENSATKAGNLPSVKKDPSAISSSAAPSSPNPSTTPNSEKYATAYADLLAAAQGEDESEYISYIDQFLPPEHLPVKLIAFYLPQFHPIPENDQWWGRGFTEWTNVSKAAPQFIGHYQPHLPGELGFYDLRVPEVQRRQVELAKNYGISGFCFYYYWFNGKRLLERPLNQFMNDPEIDFPFCICWANENWTRRWDGFEQDILMEQKHDEESDFSFIRDILPIIQHKNYIKVNGRPVVILYRVSLLPNPRATVQRWREFCKSQGVAEPYFIAAQTFGFSDPREVNFDAAVEFPPHNYRWVRIDSGLNILNKNYLGRVFNYADIATKTSTNEESYKLFRTVFPSWDNEPRMLGKGFSFAFSSPRLYQAWLTRACRQVLKNSDPDERLVFINAWNEWGEGAHLEPDRKYGYAYLQATSNALDSLRSVEFSLSMPPKCHDTAVILHLYYLELWDEIRSYLANLEGDFDLYVSIPLTAAFSEQVVLEHYPDAVIYRCRNRGRDMAPFMDILSAIDPLDYKYVCKIHTKRSTHREDGDDWRRDLFGKLLGSQAVITNLKRALDDDPAAGVLGPKGHIVPGGYFWGENADTVARLARQAGIPLESTKFYFVAGSMFWFKPFALQPLISLGLTTENFEPELGQQDGTLAHAIERMIGLAAQRSGCRLLEIDLDGSVGAVTTRGAQYEHAMPTDRHNRILQLDPDSTVPESRAVSRDPVIVYQMGKVGSATVQHSLIAAYKSLKTNISVHHIHNLYNLEAMERDVAKTRHNPEDTLIGIRQGLELKSQMDKDPTRHWKVISLVRDPVARNVSDFFHGLPEILPDWRQLYQAGELGIDELQDIFLNRFDHHITPKIWFDTQMKTVFDIDVYARPFPFDKGFEIYPESSRASLLLIRLEDLNRVAQLAMSEFLGLADFQLVNANVADNKEYAPLYEAFRQKPLPADYVEDIYGCKLARHFYSDEELIRFARKWTKTEG